MEENSGRQNLLVVNIFIILYIIIFISFFPSSFEGFKTDIAGFIVRNTHYENVSRWMEKHIPKGETIFHAFWSDSPFFICLNPKNNYLVVLDPIYMFYRYPREFIIYKRLKEGMISEPHKALRETFKVNYGYTRTIVPLYSQINKDTKHFEILYRDYGGIVFKFGKTKNDEGRITRPA